MPRKTLLPAESLFTLSAVLPFGVTTAFARERTTTLTPTTPTPTTGVGASHVDSPFPQDLAVGLLLVALVVLVVTLLVVRRVRRSS